MMTSTKEPVVIWGWEVLPKVGSVVKPDSWRFFEKLLPGDSFSTFRIPVTNGGPIKSLAAEVEITGRTFQRKAGERVVRVKITFPGDCEPDTVVPGYMIVPF